MHMSTNDTHRTRGTDLPVGASDSYARLRELFAVAAELNERERAAWIDANVTDADERVALERLLSVDLGEGGYLDIPADEHAARMAADEPLRVEGLIGQRIGMFRLTRLLGKGGMAVVFLGEREDADFHQKAAVKLLRRGLYSEVEQRLFRRERQLLATLEHPNIAHLIDGGVTAAGIPYLVLEYVDGDPLTQHAADRRLDVRQRLDLFLIVCRAVEAAHRALIVHRDIKPSNILVANDGTVKLLDFGIAKLLEDDVENPTIGVFTPDYAAPEQIADAPVTTATDVYALGVLLHELLLGIRPQRGSMRRPSSLAGAVASKHITVPKPALLPRALRGDLDTIVLKCLAVEPEQRYASAGALADDIQRHLAGKPVEAHPPSNWYRARKFVQRHRGSVAITVALALAIIAALGIALWQADVARHEAQRANMVRDFVEDIFSPIQNSVIEAKQTSVHDLLANATTKLDKNTGLAVGERIDLELLFSGLHEKMGEPDQALALASRASKLAESKLSPDDPAALDAEISYAYALLEHDDQAKAEPLLESLKSRIGGRRIIEGMPLVRLYDGLAIVADTKGSHEIALDYERRALDERIAHYGLESAKAATGYNNIAISLNMSGHHDEAIEAFHHSYAIHMAQEGPDSFETAIARRNLAFTELQAGQLRAARADFLAVEPLFDAPPNNKRNRNAAYWQDRCQLAIAMGAEQAKQTCAHALQLTKQVFSPDNVQWNARALRLDAQLKMELGDVDDARRDLQQANSLLTPGGDAVALGIDEYLLAVLDLAGDDSTQAAQGFAKSVDHLGHAFPAYLRVNALSARALACAGTTTPSGATCPKDSLVTARAELDAQGNPWNPLLLPGNIAIARVDLLQGHAGAAANRLNSAVAHAVSEVDATQISLLSARIWLAIAATDAGNCDRATIERQAAVDAIHRSGLDDHPLLAAALAGLRQTKPCGSSAG